jgi:hypothetical protein
MTEDRPISRITVQVRIDVLASARGGILALRRRGITRVAVLLPPLPRYHGPRMELRAEIDRGHAPSERGPVLTLFARDGESEVALVRWPTTIGTWQREKLPHGRVVTRFKRSPRGRFVWREIIAAPAWFAPDSTPDRELVSRTPTGWAAREDAIGPGYRSAYGLVMIIHRKPAGGDTGVRTHGTSTYLSIAEGSASHGCHRLYTYRALRLAGFLLGHRHVTVQGEVGDRYQRRVRWAGRHFTIERRSRGYVRELDPPVPVRVH